MKNLNINRFRYDDSPVSKGMRPLYIGWFCYVMTLLTGFTGIFILTIRNSEGIEKWSVYLSLSIFLFVIAAIFGLWHMEKWGFFYMWIVH